MDNMSILRKKAADHKGPIKHGTNETEKKRCDVQLNISFW